MLAHFGLNECELDDSGEDEFEFREEGEPASVGVDVVVGGGVFEPKPQSSENLHFESKVVFPRNGDLCTAQQHFGGEAVGNIAQLIELAEGGFTLTARLRQVTRRGRYYEEAVS